MKRGVCVVSACCLVLVLVTGALAQVVYPPLLEAEAGLCPGCSVTMAIKDGNTLQTMLQSAEPTDTILAFYREALTAKGWTVAHEMAIDQAKSLSFERGGANLAVAAMPQEEGRTFITLIMETP